MLSTTTLPAPNSTPRPTSPAEPAWLVFGRLPAAVGRRLGIPIMLAWVLTLLLALTGCGPGTGGTGVGPIADAAPTISFGSAVATAVVSAPPALSGTPPGGDFSLPPALTLPANPACNLPCTTPVLLLLEAERVVLQGECFNFVSSTPWVVASGGSSVVAGTYQTYTTRNGQTTSSNSLANLVLQFANGQADSPSVTLRVQSPTGADLLGPLSLPRSQDVPPATGSNPVPPRLGACP